MCMYREADFGREQNEFMQEERKRREAEIMADDLFGAERVRIYSCNAFAQLSSNPAMCR